MRSGMGRILVLEGGNGWGLFQDDLGETRYRGHIKVKMINDGSQHVWKSFWVPDRVMIGLLEFLTSKWGGRLEALLKWDQDRS